MSRLKAAVRHRTPVVGLTQKAVRGGTLGTAFLAAGLGLLGLAVFAFGAWLVYSAWRFYRDSGEAEADGGAPPPPLLPDPERLVDVPAVEQPKEIVEATPPRQDHVA